MIVGAIAGVALALISMAEMLNVTVSPDAVTLTRNGEPHTIKRWGERGLQGRSASTGSRRRSAERVPTRLAT
ncbi:hypothetical protein G1H11_12910 [Phytoactinopolyspora alkaliphila]|uniref:YqeB PH domain-containing protein n=1 Tax=Phytoactinopolyspora alkaliphila TaxID=1783498 RepID=A0A6N9YMC5_9ACTN|nr:hypothetical protein [Phytoactinopolyspora alkaliphila]NED96211.1 hypothetical protein [Phytoactinopolyspora alkaliphila]